MSKSSILLISYLEDLDINLPLYQTSVSGNTKLIRYIISNKLWNLTWGNNTVGWLLNLVEKEIYDINECESS